MADTDVCVGLIVLLIIVIIVFIIAKIIGWGSRVAANIGTYRQGTAMKQVAQKGLILDQRHSVSGYPPVGYSSGQPLVCPYCGAALIPGAFRCGMCGRNVVQPAQSITAPTGPVCVSCKKPFEGGEFCNWCGARQRSKCASCGTDNAASALYCRKCGLSLQNVEQKKATPPEQTYPQTIRCPHCDSKTPRGENCIFCGKSLASEQSVPTRRLKT